MKFRKQSSSENPNPAQNGNAASGHLDRLRRAANEFLAAGDDAINRALSGQSEAFLKANRQQSGE